MVVSMSGVSTGELGGVSTISMGSEKAGDVTDGGGLCNSRVTICIGKK